MAAQDLLDAVVQGCLNDIPAAEDVGLDGFHRVVLAGRHVLEGSRVEHHVDPLESMTQTVRVADVADQVAAGGEDACTDHVGHHQSGGGRQSEGAAPGGGSGSGF